MCKFKKKLKKVLVKGPNGICWVNLAAGICEDGEQLYTCLAGPDV